MTNKYDYPFQCERCEQLPPEKFARYKPPDDWMTIYPETQEIHLHFGFPTTSEEQHSEETEWLYKQTVEKWLPQHPDTPFFIYVDMTRSDDSEFPSEPSMDLYKKMLRHPQNSQTVFYGQTQSMVFFINMLARFAKTYKKVHAVETKEEADAMYQEWYENNKKNP